MTDDQKRDPAASSGQPAQDQELREKLERIDSKAKSLKADISGANEKIGYVAESVETFKKGYEVILNRYSTQDDAFQTIASGNTMADAIEQQLDDLNKRVGRVSYQLEFAMPLFVATTSTAVTSVNSFAQFR
jgi:archaellum component FlaC